MEGQLGHFQYWVIISDAATKSHGQHCLSPFSMMLALVSLVDAFYQDQVISLFSHLLRNN